MDEQAATARPPGATPRGAASDRRPGTFTRADLDAAEPEVPPSFRRRWLIGLVLGSVGGMVAGWAGPISLLALVALPWAFTPAGSAVLVGSGFVWATFLVVLGGEIARDGIATWPVNVAVPVLLLGIGLVGTVVAWRRRSDR